MWTLSLVFLLAAAIPLHAEPIASRDRSKALSYLHATRKMFLDEIAGLSPRQWTFKPAPDRWSVAECAEHIALTEEFLWNHVAKTVLTLPPAAAKREVTEADDEAVIARMTDRGSPAQAPEPLRPSERFAGPGEVIAAFKDRRDRTTAFIRDTQEDLRARVSAPPRELDAYQWILMLAAHSERHTLQIREVKAHPEFPK